MSTLDDTFEQLQIFDRELLEFNQALRVSLADLRRSDAEIGALWRDDASAQYRAVYEPMAESLERYLKADAPRFEAFLQAKIRQLAIFLHEQ